MASDVKPLIRDLFSLQKLDVYLDRLGRDRGEPARHLLEQRRGEAVSRIPEPYCDWYAGARARVPAAPWILWVRDDVCEGCRLMLPSQILSEARRTGNPVVCPRCHRLLIWEDAAGDGRTGPERREGAARR